MMLDPVGKGLDSESPWGCHLEFWSEAIMNNVSMTNDGIIGEFMIIADDVLKRDW